MNRKITTYFHVFLFLIIIKAIFFVDHSSVLCWGSVHSSGEVHFSLSSKNESLSKVFDKIKNNTGYDIFFQGRKPMISLTLELHNVSLDMGLKRIIKNLNINNYSIITDNTMKKIDILVFESNKFSNAEAENSLLVRKEEIKKTDQRVDIEDIQEKKKEYDKKNGTTNPLDLNISKEDIQEKKKEYDKKNIITNPLDLNISKEDIQEKKKEYDKKNIITNPLDLYISKEDIQEKKKEYDKKSTKIIPINPNKLKDEVQE